MTSESGEEPEAKRRRVEGSTCQVKLEVKPVLRLCEESVGQREVVFGFEKTPECKVLRADTAEEFRRILDDEAALAAKSSENWLRHPRAKWICDMAAELSQVQRRPLHAMQDDLGPEPESWSFMEKWEESTTLGSAILTRWFDGKSLQDVIERAKDLGHMDAELARAGCLLQGKFIDELATRQDMNFDTLLPIVEKMAGPRGMLPVYKVRAQNCFQQEQRHAVHVSELQPKHGQGSLNTTWTYDLDDDELTASGVPLLDDFTASVMHAVKECSGVELNRRMYFIWKFQHYVTSYHQDVHVPPHMTIYNQVSGVSLFHFLPVLVGLYVSHVGRRSPELLRDVLVQIDQAGIGSLATLRPGQVALIMPFGSHGVWVPGTDKNPSLPSFDVSAIRAAELFVKPTLDMCRKMLSSPDWNKLLDATADEVQELADFQKAQEKLLEAMQIEKKHWLSLVERTWKHWKMSADGVNGSDAEPPLV